MFIFWHGNVFNGIGECETEVIYLPREKLQSQNSDKTDKNGQADKVTIPRYMKKIRNCPNEYEDEEGEKQCFLILNQSSINFICLMHFYSGISISFLFLILPRIIISWSSNEIGSYCISNGISEVGGGALSFAPRLLGHFDKDFTKRVYFSQFFPHPPI